MTEGTPKTVAELLSTREAWTKRSMGRRLVNGREVAWFHWDECNCFCLAGAIHKVYGYGSAATQALKKVSLRIGGKRPFDSDEDHVILWNDRSERTWEEVLKMAQEAGI